jgi:hypothetical protein
VSRTFSDSLETDLGAAFFSTNEFARSFTLRRGAASTTGVAAIVAARQYEATDSHGVTVAYAALDLDLAASAYLVSAAVVEPRAGDRMEDAASGVIYEVLPIPGGQCFEPSEDGLVLSVHVKKVS